MKHTKATNRRTRCRKAYFSLAVLLSALSALLAPLPWAAPGDLAGPEFQVNGHTDGDQIHPSVGMDANGNFVVAWEGDGSDPDGQDDYAIYAQRYTSNGERQGSEFRVNDDTSGSESNPSVAMDADGNFVVAWEAGLGSDQGISYYPISAQRYASNGMPQGSQFLVNSDESYNKTAPSVAMDEDGDFVVAWESNGQDGSGYGIYARRYYGVEPAIVNDDLAVPTLSGFQFIPGDQGDEATAGVYQFTAEFCNDGGGSTLSALASRTAAISAHASLISRDRDGSERPGGVGSEQDFDIPSSGDYSDGDLSGTQCTTITYDIGLTSRSRFSIYVDIWGERN